VRRAASLYRLHLAIALGGSLAVLLGLLVALDAATTHQQAPRMLVLAVVFSPSTISGANAALLLALGAITTVSLALGLRAAAIEYRAQRRASRLLGSSARVAVGSAGVRVIGDERPRAFCHGLLRPRIYVSSGALAALSAPQLAVLVAHERHHALRRDPLRLAVARVLSDALFFLPMLQRLLERYAEQAELAADEAASRDGQDLAALAAALLAFDERGVGVHPDRVDRLLGQPVDARMPMASILTAAGMIAAVVVLGLAGATLNGHDYRFVVVPALLVATALAAVALVAPMGLLSSLVGWRRGHRSR
jgi:Zn-dependent protease with chaperone function